MPGLWTPPRRLWLPGSCVPVPLRLADIPDIPEIPGMGFHRLSGGKGSGGKGSGGGGKGGGGGKTPTPIAAPSLLTATPSGSDTIDLAWQDNQTSPNESGFKIERGDAEEGPFVQIGTAAADAESYQDTGLDPETEYFYRVRAYRGANNSAYSNVASGETGAAGPEPPPIAGYLVWLDSENELYQNSAMTTPAVAGDDPIGGWGDLSGNAHHVVQATAANRPQLKLNQLNGYPCVQFDGSNNYLKATPWTYPQPWTEFLVVRSLTWALSDTYVDGNTAESAIFFDSPSSPTARMYAGFLMTGVGMPVNTWWIICCVFNGASSRVRQNALTAVTGNANPNARGGLTIGAKADGTGAKHFDLVTHLIYPSVLSVEDETTVRDWLNTKYAVF